jgi:hypothetical protein
VRVGFADAGDFGAVQCVDAVQLLDGEVVGGTTVMLVNVRPGDADR